MTHHGMRDMTLQMREPLLLQSPERSLSVSTHSTLLRLSIWCTPLYGRLIGGANKSVRNENNTRGYLYNEPRELTVSPCSNS